MSASIEREQRLVEYLLGGLLPEERVQTEERLFGDDELHEEFEATADDLIHVYLAGTLSRDDRVRFETHFLASPRRRQRLEFVRGLLAAVDRVAANERTGDRLETHRPVWRPWMLPAAAAIVAAAILAVLGRPSSQGIERASAGPVPRVSAAPTPGPVETPLPQRPRPLEVSVVRLTRNSSSVPVAPETRLVRLEVAVTEDRPSYDAVLRTADGTEVWRAEGLAPSKAGEPLAVAVPAHIFTSDVYALAVEGEALRGEPRRALLRVEYRLHVVRER
jgi:hypothetical protein